MDPDMKKSTTSSIDQTDYRQDDREDDVRLPGFRFHPTDEELVGFYLRRKVEKRPISIELIKQIDIYKYDPWDLPNHFPSLRVSEIHVKRRFLILQEVWTLCRILKRCATYRKSVPDRKELYAKRNNASLDSSSKTCIIESDNGLAYISFRAPGTNEKKPFTHQINDANQLLTDHQLSSTSQAPSTASYSSFVSPDANDFLKHGDWDELRSIVGFVADPFFV
ncbi:hypothetical protein RJ639_036477 [Escallonia herrerae]|uniref:NAC domain-containing protein n=1 Tax=Escallonia herrerae TaxID=1293975 RepID=A0AA89BAG0_9ASTE|nr:hypothetical protein RJ639_036477 [Escallonia herrerae]